MSKIFLLLGGNSGSRSLNLKMAAQKITSYIGPVIATSSLYETEPWGFYHKTPFLNQLIISTTLLSPSDALAIILDIEQSLGRIRKEVGYRERTIDIDILFYDNQIVESKDLTVPHPRLHERRFALEPLAELQPEMVHPVFNKTITQLLAECPDKKRVVKIENH